MLLDPPYKKWIIDSFLSSTMYHLENCLPIHYVLLTFLVSNGKHLCTYLQLSHNTYVHMYTIVIN